MDFQIYTTSGNIQQYISILKKYNLRIETEMKKVYPTDRELREFQYYHIIINNLKELVQFTNEINEELIFYDGALEIYDDYRE